MSCSGAVRDVWTVAGTITAQCGAGPTALARLGSWLRDSPNREAMILGQNLNLARLTRPSAQRYNAAVPNRVQVRSLCVREESDTCPHIQSGSSVAADGTAAGLMMRSRRMSWSPAGTVAPSSRRTRSAPNAGTTAGGKSSSPRRKRRKRNRLGRAVVARPFCFRARSSSVALGLRPESARQRWTI